MPIRKKHIVVVANYKNGKCLRVSVQIIVVFGNKRHTLIAFMHNLYHNGAAVKDRFNIQYLPLLRCCWFY